MDWVPYITVFVGASAAILAGLIWIIRAQISMSREFQPNHGSSIKDQLTRIEQDVRELRGRLDDHVQFHLEEGSK